MKSKAIFVWAGMASAVLAGVGLAQHAADGPQGSAAAARGGPFGFAAYGAFQRMVHARDFSAKVRLQAVMSAGATDAVGAAEELRAEITIIDGKLLVTYGTPCATCGPSISESASLLASARVQQWNKPVALSTDLAGQALDDFIVAQAKLAGLDVAQPFPVRMKGTLVAVRMHLLQGVNPEFKGHGGGHKFARQEVIAADRVEGEVVGFYAPSALQGVITHPGEPFHYHWVDGGRTRTAHLDTFGMTKGSTLLLPRQ